MVLMWLTLLFFGSSAIANDSPFMYKLDVFSEVKSRYAKTTISAEVKNADCDEAREYFFNMTVPKAAFVSGFVVRLVDAVIEAEV